MALTLFVDTFLTLSEADALLSGQSAWTSSLAGQKQTALRDATSALNEFRWIGYAKSSTQTLAWPRKKLTFHDPVLNLAVVVPEDEVPFRLKRAVANLALHYRNFPAAVGNFEPSFDRIKLGPLEIEDNNTEAKPPKIPSREVKQVIAPLLAEGGMGGSWWRAN